MKPEAEIKKIISYILTQFKYFFVNPFWRSWVILAVVVLGLAVNGYIWYFYLVKMRSLYSLSGLTPVGYASGVLLLNIFLADITFSKQLIISWILLSIALLIQIIFLVFLKFSIGG